MKHIIAILAIFWFSINVFGQNTEIPTKSTKPQKESKIVDIDSFEEVIYEHLGNIFVKENGKWGVLNREFQRLVECKYDYIAYAWDNDKSEKSHNYIVVQNDKFGKITETGKVIFPCQYDGITTWVEYGPDGHYVRISDKIGLISYDGKIIIPIKYDKVKYLYGTDWVMIYDKGKMGLYDLKAKEFFLPLEYDFLYVDYTWLSIERNKPTRIITYKDGLVNVLDKTGKIIKPNISKTEVKKKFGVDINEYHYSPCSYELILMKQNRAYNPPDCLLKRIGQLNASIYYSMEKDK